jgi:nitronate monooxygenase
VVIAQGSEAGGHVRSTTTLLPLLAGVLDAVDVPVLGAGAIGHPRTLAAVLAAGAAGARVGTAFIATVESGAHPIYKQAVVDAGRGDTVITDTFSNQCPLCATSPRHRVLGACVRAAQSLAAGEIGVAQYGSRAVSLLNGSPLSPSTTTTGHIEAMAMYASDAAADASTIRPAADVITWLCEGADALLMRDR